MTYQTLIRRPAMGRSVVPSVDRLMADLFRDLRTPLPTPMRLVARPPVKARFDPNISAEEFENEFRVVAEIPGVDVSDLDVNVEDGVLIIKGERLYAKAPAADFEASASSDEAGDEAASTPVEAAGEPEPASVAASPSRLGAKFERRIAFRTEILEEGVSASLKNGVLTVTVPKPRVVEPEVRAIPIETA